MAFDAGMQVVVEPPRRVLCHSAVAQGRPVRSLGGAVPGRAFQGCLCTHLPASVATIMVGRLCHMAAVGERKSVTAAGVQGSSDAGGAWWPFWYFGEVWLSLSYSN
jgi:hypothetical protein